MEDKPFKALRYIFTWIAFIFVICVWFSSHKTLYLGFVTLSVSAGYLMHIVGVKRGESEDNKLFLSIIPCCLCFLVSLYIFSITL